MVNAGMVNALEGAVFRTSKACFLAETAGFLARKTYINYVRRFRKTKWPAFVTLS
jgi:hypothetical protein